MAYIDLSQNSNLINAKLYNQTISGYSVSSSGNSSMPYKFDFMQIIPENLINDIVSATYPTAINGVNAQLMNYDGDMEINTIYSDDTAMFASRPSKITYGYRGIHNAIMNVTIYLVGHSGTSAISATQQVESKAVLQVIRKVL